MSTIVLVILLLASWGTTCLALAVLWTFTTRLSRQEARFDLLEALLSAQDIVTSHTLIHTHDEEGDVPW